MEEKVGRRIVEVVIAEEQRTHHQSLVVEIVRKVYSGNPPADY
jgi:hypothetical protein